MVAMRSEALVCDLSFARIAGSNPGGGMDVSHVSVVCSQVDVSARGRSLVQRSPTECVFLSVIRCYSNSSAPTMSR